MPSKIRDIAEILGVTETSNTSNAALITAAEAGGGGGATSYDSAGALPTSGNTAGDLAFTTDKKALYNWDGSEWDRVYSGPNETLTWDSALSATYIFDGQQRQIDISDSSDISFTVAANADFEGFPITYSYQTVPADPVQLDSAAFGGDGISQSGGTFTLRCSSRDSDEGDFTFRAKATDGTHVITSSTTISLAFASDIVYNAVDNASVGGTFPQTNALVATIGGNTGSSMMWGTTNPISELLPTGKRYFELRPNSSGGSVRYIFGLSGYGRGTTTVQYIGFWYLGSSQGHSGTALSATNDTNIMFAYDTDTRTVWYGQNGTWVNGTPGVSGGDTTTITALPDGSFYLGWCSGSSSGAIIDATLYTGANLNYAKPTGFKSV
jgi:hypothetical protein